MKEVLKTLKELNDCILDKYEDYFQLICLETDGVLHRFLYKNIEIWNSEHDEREYNELTNEYGDLTIHVKKLFNELIESLNDLRFDIKEE